MPCTYVMPPLAAAGLLARLSWFSTRAQAEFKSRKLISAADFMEHLLDDMQTEWQNRLDLCTVEGSLTFLPCLRIRTKVISSDSEFTGRYLCYLQTLDVHRDNISWLLSKVCCNASCHVLHTRHDASFTSMSIQTYVSEAPIWAWTHCRGMTAHSREVMHLKTTTFIEQ